MGKITNRTHTALLRQLSKNNSIGNVNNLLHKENDSIEVNRHA